MRGGNNTGLTVLLTACVAMGVTSITLYVPSMPSIAVDLETTQSLVQTTLGLFLIGFAGGQLVYGPMSDRFGRRPVMLGGLAIYVVASLLCSQASAIEELQVLRLLQGLGGAVGPVVARAVVRDRFQGPEAVKVFSFIGTVLALAPAIGPIIGGQVEVWFGWQANFYFLAAFGGFLALMCFLFLAESNTDKNPDATAVKGLARTYGGLLRHGYFMGTVLIGSLIFGGVFAYTGMVPFLFIEELGISPDDFGWLMIFTVGSYAMGTHLSGRLAAPMGARRLIVTGACVTLVGAVLLLTFSRELSLVRVIGPMMLYFLGFGLCMPATMGAAMQPFPKIAGSASALMGFLQMALAGLGSFLVQPLYDGTALPLGVMAVLLVMTALTVFLALAWPQMKPATPEPGE